MSPEDRPAELARIAYQALAWIFVACLVVQIFLVGLDLFEVIGTEAGVHRAFAYTYGWLAPILVLLAVAGRLPRHRLWLTMLLLVLFALQTYLPTLKDQAPWIAAFHAVNALFIFWLAVRLALLSREDLTPHLPTGG
jgi:hypothetical protein